MNSDLLSDVNEINTLSVTADEPEQGLQKRRNFTPSDSFPLKFIQRFTGLIEVILKIKQRLKQG